MSDIVIFLTSGSTWTVPNDCSAAKIEIIAPGGGGGDRTGSGSRCPGGGGGAYSKTDELPLTPGQTVYISIPDRTAPNHDAPSAWLNKNANSAPASTSDGCLAAGGKKGPQATGAANGGLGGSASDCIGDTKYNGGKGGNSQGGTGNGGGGGAAGPNGDGVAGNLTVGGNGDNNFGGAGASSNNPGGDGTEWTQTSDSATAGSGGGGGGLNAGPGGQYGGGGGGMRGTSAFGTGFGGAAIIVITYALVASTGYSRGYIIA